MISRSDIERNLVEWIDVANSHKLYLKSKGFWLLLDYLCEQFPVIYYRDHLLDAKEVIASIDPSKGNNAEIIRFFEQELEKYE